MPVITKSTYRPIYLLSNKHITTIVPSVFRRVNIKYDRERLTTLDNDFIDLDYSSKKSKTITLILHGLEGSSNSSNVKGIVKVINQNNWDAVVFNFRGCSGTPNNLLSAYHSGKTDDLDFVVKHLQKSYEEIFLVGFSLGGNIILKYLGEKYESIKAIKKAVAISVPCDLKSSAIQMEKLSNKVYMNRFLKTLKNKVFSKCKIYTEHSINLELIKNATTFADFDNEYTAPIHGFRTANNYWKVNSSKQFLKSSVTPTLLINALDDPFLTKQCFPFEIANASKTLFLETPEKGGHMGFLSKTGINGIYWHEQRVIDFLETTR